jgi:hypothetical protein
MGNSVVGCDDDLPFGYLIEGNSYAFVTVGSIGYPHLRIKLSNIISRFRFYSSKHNRQCLQM